MLCRFISMLEQIQITSSTTRSAATRTPVRVIPFVTMPLVLAFFVSTQAALAHDNWISRHHFYDPVSGAWCCDEHDCSALEDIEVREMGEGFMVGGQYFVARQHVLPSSDGQYWACFNSEGRGPHDREKGVRCFFAPINS